MPNLHRMGKEKVLNHHHEVPYKVLEKQYTFGDEKNDNKIIHGDNLEALKSLLPEYEGKIKCIYIDPPYNTGNEGRVYNDNVSHPKIKKWLNQVVGKEGEDLSRHDKWLCMMYPRLKLLHKLLRDDGVIFISIDDNEQASLRLMLDEIFGENNRIADLIVIRAEGGGMAKHVIKGHEYLFAYTKNISVFTPLAKPKDIRGKIIEKQGEQFWIQEDRLRKEFGKYGNCHYEEIEKYKGLEKKQEIDEGIKKGDYILIPKDNGMNIVGKLRNISEDGSKFYSITKHLSANGIKDLSELGLNKIFDYPKPVSLLMELVLGATFFTKKNGDIVLDSFAGSGTTANAVLNLNKQDGGNRKFILIEMEDYAESITAERVKRVIKGYGEESKKVDGTGGGFSYYELGQPLFLDEESLNEEVGEDKLREYIWYTETKTPFVENKKKNKYYLGGLHDSDYYFYYEKNKSTTLDYDFLATLDTKKGKQHIIYADICLLDEDFMRKHNIIFKKIPRDITRF